MPIEYIVSHFPPTWLHLQGSLSHYFGHVLMAVINTCVAGFHSKVTLLPWMIMLLEEESYTFNDFFNVSVQPRIINCAATSSHTKVISAYVGPEKSDLSLDFVDIHLCVLPVISSFVDF